MNIDHTDTAIFGAVAGLSATFIEDLLTRTLSGILVAVVSALVVSGVKKLLKDKKTRDDEDPPEPPE